MGAPVEPPFLGQDKVLRFVDEDHYQSEFQSNLAHGRIFTRIEDGLKVGIELQFEIEHPINQQTTQVLGRVVFQSSGQVGFELRNFNDALKEELKDLGLAPTPETKPEPPAETHEETAPEEPIKPPQVQRIRTPRTIKKPEPVAEQKARRVRTGTAPLRPRRKLKSASQAASIASIQKPADTPVETQSSASESPVETIQEVGPDDIQDEVRALPHLGPKSRMFIEGPFQLLGLYISQIRHGFLSFSSDRELEVDDVVTIRVVCGHTLALTGDLVAKEGSVYTVKLDDAWSVEALLKESSEEWRTQVLALGGEKSLPRQALERSATIVNIQSEEKPEPEAEVEAEAVQEEAQAVVAQSFEKPILRGDTVHFLSREALQLELENNLKNGGLAVQSGPIGIRSHRTLKIMVDDEPLSVTLEADVVFADQGIVGFQLSQPDAVIGPLQAFLAGEKVPASGAGAKTTADGPIFAGRIARPDGLIQLIDFPGVRVEDAHELGRANVLLVIDYIARKQLTGILSLNRKDEQKLIHFQDGNLVFVSSTPQDEEKTLLGRILLRHKKITEPALREALESAKAQSKPLGKTLVSAGHIKAQTLAAALREQMRLNLESAFDWTAGQHEFRPWQAPSIEAELVATRGLSIVTRRIRNRLEHITSNEIEALFGPSLRRTICPNSDIETASQGLGLQSKELRFCAGSLNRDRELSAAVTGSPLGRLGSLRLTGLALAMGLIEFKDGRGASQGRKAPPRKPTHLRDQDALKESIAEHLEIMKNQNHFDVLEIHWSASHRTYDAAKKNVKQRFNLEQGPLRAADQDVKKIVKEIHRRIDEAHKLLSQQQERIQYRKKLFDATERQYSSEMLLKQGDVLIMRGDRIAGIEAFETAYELRPNQKTKSLLEAARDGE